MNKSSKSTTKKSTSKSKIKKYESGGLVGKQKNLDMNKNNKLDKTDFQMLRTRKK